MQIRIGNDNRFAERKEVGHPLILPFKTFFV